MCIRDSKKDPVKVTVELPSGKVITVEVPVNVTPVKEIETPVTKTPLTPEDYTKGIKIPEGGKMCIRDRYRQSRLLLQQNNLHRYD